MMEISRIEIEKPEDALWVIEEFINLNLSKCESLEMFMEWKYEIKISDKILLLSGDYYSCIIGIDTDKEHAEKIADEIQNLIGNQVVKWLTDKGMIV